MFKGLMCFVSIFVELCLVGNSSAGLVAHWKFDNDSVDSAGNLNWTLENGAGYSTDSKTGSYSLSLDGTDDRAVQPAAGALSEEFSTKTLTFWFKADANNVTQTLYDEGGATNGLSVRINGNYLQAAVRNTGIEVVASAGFDSTRWTHVAVTFDKGILSLYINAAERALASANFTTVASHADAAGIGARNSQDAFGNKETGDYFGGLIDDVRIYDNVLTVDEIKELATGRPETVIVQPESQQPKVEPAKAEPEEIEPEQPKPVEAPSVPERLLRRSVFDIGPELYSFKYEEPGVMEEEGTFYGVAFDYTYREWVSDSPEQSLSYDKKRMTRFEGRFASGEVDYDGALSDGTPYTMDGIDDFVLEGRMLFGADWLRSNKLNTFYMGLGYRYLNDDPSSDPVGYERESNYYYVPIGYEIDTNLRAGWSWAGRLEFDLLLWGEQKSHLSDIDPSNPDLENDQDSGYGYRASMKIHYKSTNVNFAIEPFFRYWDIDKSEVIYPYVVWEPKNETSEFGIQLIWMF